MFDFFKRKAITGTSQGLEYDSLYKIIHGQTDNQTPTAQDLIRLNGGWVFACNNKNAMSVATTPLHLYYNNKFNKNIKWTNHHKLDVKELRSLRNSIPSVELKQAQDVVEILEHPFIDLLKNINDEQNYTDFTYLVESYLGLIGNAYVLVVNGEDGLPTELKVLQSENVSIMIEESGAITGYKLTWTYASQEKFIVYSPKEVIHFKNIVPGSKYYGKGELESCLCPVRRYNYYDAFESYLNKNYSRPDFIVSYKGKYTEKELKDAQKQWYKQFGSVKNAGKPLITSELDINTLGYSPKDMSFPSGRAACIKEISAVFGVPEALLDLNSANLASAKSASNHYYSFTIVPKLRAICEKYNEQLLPKYDTNLFLWYSDKDFLQPQEMTYQDVLAAQSQGVISPDEARESMGYQPSKKEV